MQFLVSYLMYQSSSAKHNFLNFWPAFSHILECCIYFPTAEEMLSVLKILKPEDGFGLHRNSYLKAKLFM